MYIINDIYFNSTEQIITCCNKKVQLNPKTNQLLLFMVQNSNKTLSREAILTSVWERDFVNDHCLTQAISDLRKALLELNDKYKKVIVTRPKVGYSLIANVRQVEQDISLSNESYLSESKKVQIGNKNIRIKLFIIFLSLCILGIVWQRSAVTTVIDPFYIAVTKFESEPEYQHIAFGFSELLNEQFNQQGYYRSTFLSDKNLIASSTASLLISGRIHKKDKQVMLAVSVYDKFSNKIFFDKQYLLSGDLVIKVPKAIVSDIGNVLGILLQYDKIDDFTLYNLKDAEIFNLLNQANYASNTLTKHSLFAAIKIYDQVLSLNSDLEVALARRFISAKILNFIFPNTLTDDEIELLLEPLLNMERQGSNPIYFEALAINMFNIDLAKAKQLLNQAQTKNGSWLSYILAGKIAEVEGKKYQSVVFYQRAYSMKPDATTQQVINTLLFPTDVDQFDLF